MNTLQRQVNTLKKRMQIKVEERPLRFDKQKKDYIKKLFLVQKKHILRLLALVIGISLIEISAPLFLDIFLSKHSFNLRANTLFAAGIILFLIVIIYLVISYFALAIQKRLTLNIINKVREDWLRFYINKKPLTLNSKDKGNVFVKISYHLSLLQMGLGNSLFSFFQWILYFGGVLIVSAIIDIKLLSISLIFIPINILIVGISYIFSAYYLAKDQTLYSKILRYISDTFERFELVKSFNKENTFIREVNDMIEIDNHFRIKREIVLRYGNNIIFAILTLLTIGTYIINLYNPTLLAFTSTSSLVQILIFGLHLRLVYLSMRMGLFYFPLKLGLFLSVPPTIFFKKGKHLKSIQHLGFRTPKVKLFTNDSYQKNIQFDFEKGKNYLILHSKEERLVNMNHVFAGIASYRKGIQWVVHANKQRLLYSRFYEAQKNIFYIHKNLYSHGSIYELLNNHSNLETLTQYPEFDFIFQKRKFVADNYSPENFDIQDLFLIQVAYCLMANPDIVVVDECYADIHYDRINEGIDLLRLKYDGILIVSSRNNSQNQDNYHVTYTLRKK
ncbi:MAG: ABC transporter transmembrane domain-containing protein [Candidatus Pacebacteria bacterium]|nr:ABC transporter transmembrane domain-containing protein [Candidatus Paceibacterota bacterium]